MEVKRFISSTMQEALKMVREELGPDAVILSNNKNEGGVEIVAALGYEEDVAPETIERQLATEGRPSPSQIARMHADNHLKLQKELESAKRKIETAKQKAQKSTQADTSVAPLSRSVLARESEHDSYISNNHHVAIGAEVNSINGGESIAEISEMKNQLAELKALIQDNRNDAVPVSREPVTSQTYQQLEKKLHALGVSDNVKNTLLKLVDDTLDYGTNWKRITQRLSHLMTADDEELIDRGGCFALLGPTGSGKTMTIGKLAARYVMKYGAEGLALVTTDRYRIAAHEQLKVFGRILNVPVYAVDEFNTLEKILDSLSAKKLVLIDTAGLTHVDACWSEQLQEVRMAGSRVESYLTVSSVGQYQVMCSSYHHYKMVGLKGAIITKLDEAVSLGEVMSFLIDTRLRAAYFTDGQRVPEDIHQFRKDDLVERAQALLNSSERWVSIAPHDTDSKDDFLFSHSA